MSAGTKSNVMFIPLRILVTEACEILRNIFFNNIKIIGKTLSPSHRGNIITNILGKYCNPQGGNEITNILGKYCHSQGGNKITNILGKYCHPQGVNKITNILGK